jgi:plasmid stabilization system protein ParE
MKQVVLRPAAAADIEDAYQWYESQRPGLGEEFLAALWLARDRMLQHPEAFPILHRETRRALIPKRFPYGLFCRIYG